MKQIIIFSLSLVFINLSSQELLGPIEVCSEECYEYQIIGTTDLLFWQLTGGVIDNNQGSTVNICWEEPQTATLTVKSLIAGKVEVVLQQTIIIAAKPEAEILFPLYPECATNDTIRDQEEFQKLESCKKVCPGSKVSYRALGDQNNLTHWKVEGMLNFFESGSEVVVDWPEAGFGSLNLVQENDQGCRD